MSPNNLPSESVAVVGCIDPDAYGTGDYQTGYVSLALFRRFQAIVMAGTLGSSATLDAKIIAYTDAAGNGAADVTGAAITQLTQAGTDSDKQAIINLDTQTLAGSGKTHIRLQMTVGTATSDAGALLLGFDPLYRPASDNDSTAVDSITSA
jgi:hypothetical protein